MTRNSSFGYNSRIFHSSFFIFNSIDLGFRSPEEKRFKIRSVGLITLFAIRGLRLPACTISYTHASNVSVDQLILAHAEIVEVSNNKNKS
jgi:hypothetical protein